MHVKDDIIFDRVRIFELTGVDMVIATDDVDMAAAACCCSSTSSISELCLSMCSLSSFVDANSWLQLEQIK